MGGPGEVVQKDESLLREKRKYHWGQFAFGDQFGENIISDDNLDSNSDKENVANRTNRNYGQRVEGPWVFGLSCKDDRVNKKTIFCS